MDDAVESCADLIESSNEPCVDLADISERLRDLERGADFSRASERIEVASVPVPPLRASAFCDVESD